MRSRKSSPVRATIATLVVLATLASCGGDDGGGDTEQTSATTTAAPATTTTAPAPVSTLPPTTTAMPFTVPGRAPLAGMPRNTDATNVYADTVKIADVIKDAKNLVYVPHNESADVWVIDPTTYKVVDRYPTGAIAQHVVPSYDLKTLWVNNNAGNTLTPVDPMTGKPGKNIPVEAPYNLYYTPDGKYMIVMEERNNVMAFRDPSTPNLDVVQKVKVPCRGVNHADFSPDGTYFIATCEFSGQLIKFNLVTMSLDPKVINLDANASQPQDVRLIPDGSRFLVADMAANGLWEVDGDKWEVIRFLEGDKGPHGIYPSRDAKVMYISNRNAGSISVYDVASRAITKTWKIPGGGSPDMGGISADGKVFWVSGRNHGVVYAIDVVNWELLAKIPVGRGPHGLAVYPQPGRYSLGHTGNMR
jgi:DNA-binding beta-propeller fold protein YncE